MNSKYFLTMETLLWWWLHSYRTKSSHFSRKGYINQKIQPMLLGFVGITGWNTSHTMLLLPSYMRKAVECYTAKIAYNYNAWYIWYYQSLLFNALAYLRLKLGTETEKTDSFAHSTRPHFWFPNKNQSPNSAQVENVWKKDAFMHLRNQRSLKPALLWVSAALPCPRFKPVIFREVGTFRDLWCFMVFTQTWERWRTLYKYSNSGLGAAYRLSA